MSHLPGVQLHPRLPPRFVHGVPGEDLWRRRGSGCPDSRALHLTLLRCFPLCFQREDMLARSGAPRRRGWRGVGPRAAGQHQLLLSGALSSERRAGPLGVGALVRPHASSPGCSARQGAAQDPRFPCLLPSVLLLGEVRSGGQGKGLYPHADCPLHIPQGGCGQSGNKPRACA